MRPSLELLEDRQMLSAVTWTIDQALSSATVALPDQAVTVPDIGNATIRIRNTSGSDGGPWNAGNSAPIAGTISTNYVDGSSIEFLAGQHAAVGVNSGNYIPNPANWNGTEFTSNASGPGVFGGRIRATALIFFTEDVAWFNFTDVEYDLQSAVLAITGTNFAANQTDVGIESLLVNALGDDDVLGFGQVIPDTQLVLADQIEDNSAPTGTVAVTGAMTRRLTLPVNIPVSVVIPGENEGDPDLATITGSITGSIVANATLPPPNSSTVTGRRLFYNNSAYDVGFSDDNSAIATDKVAYIPNGSNTVGPQNVSSYTAGINGIMVDLTGTHGTITAADFTVKMSQQNLDALNTNPSAWVAAPSFTVTSLGTFTGADRYELIWADGAITNRYVEVIVEGNDALGGNNTNTGLATSDYFFYGNMVGESFNGFAVDGLFVVDQTDEVAVRFNNGFFGDITFIENVFDFNRDFAVDALDEVAARFNGNFMLAFSTTNPPNAPAGGDGSESAVASALASAGGGGSTSAAAAGAALLPDDDDDAPAAAPAAAITAGAAADAAASGDSGADLVEVIDEDLLDALLS